MSSTNALTCLCFISWLLSVGMAQGDANTKSEAGEHLLPSQVTPERRLPDWDFGDAPDTARSGGYPTLLANDGARHFHNSNVLLGHRIDAEPDGQPNASATGDDTDAEGNDDDGVSFTTPLVPGETAGIRVVASTRGRLNAWIDFNADGDWADKGEHVLSNILINGGSNALPLDVPFSAQAGPTFARFRFDLGGGLSYTGATTNGEVEDYHIVIRRPVTPDHFEPNNSLKQAVDLGMFGQRRTGLTMNGAGDEDWYSWHSGSGGVLQVDLESETEQGDFQTDMFTMELHGSDGKLLTRAIRSDSTKTLSFEVAPDEEYFIRVIGNGAMLDPEYILDILFRGSENYAVLFAGGARPAKNYQRYYNNTRDLYNILVGTYKLDPDNIFVLYADGTDPGADLSDGDDFVDSDMSYARHVLAATPENLEEVLTQILARRIDWNDHFFFWSFDHGGGNTDEPETLDEEVLVGWDSSISDVDLAAWLRTINPGRFTFVATQCYAGGMLDNLLPLAQTEHGSAATNHYESSWGDAFAGAYNDGLLTHSQSHDVYRYAYNHDGYATDGEGPGGDVAGHLEHPWEATQANFPIFSDSRNNLPWIDKVRVLRFVPPLDEVIIPYELLRGATELGDFDIRGAGFRVESVLEGQLLKNGEPVISGQTLVGPGESLTFLPPLNAGKNSIVRTNEAVSGGMFDAFTVRAYDGATISDQRLTIPMVLANDWLPAARDDQAVVYEDARNAIIKVLPNDLGTRPTSVVSVGVATHGNVQLVNGRVRYSPAAEYSGPDSFIYFMTDNSGVTDWATVSIEVIAINDPPEAYSDEFTVAANSKNNEIDILDNDFDKELKPLTYFLAQSGAYPISAILVSTPSEGILIAQKDGTFLYTPRRNFEGVDSFAYRADDGQSLSEVVTATIHVGQSRRLKWAQRPDTTGHGVGIRVDRRDGALRALADDFLCTDPGAITEVHLWGSWLNDIQGQIKQIRLSIYSDDPVGKEGSDPENPYSMPDVLLWQEAFKRDQIEERLYTTVKSGEYWWDIAYQTLIPAAQTQVWQVDITMQEGTAFQQKGTRQTPQVYWLEAQVDTEAGQFGWTTRRWPAHFNDSAVLRTNLSSKRPWQALRYPASHPYNGLHLEDLALGAIYHVGNTFTTSSVPVEVKAFLGSNGLWTGSGVVRVENGGSAGGTGLELTLENANLAFNFPVSPKILNIRFGQYGGNLNLKLNGEFRNFHRFSDINGATIGGTLVTVIQGPGPTGILRLHGTVNSLVLGGQKLTLDALQWANTIDMAFEIMTEPGKE
ncbi:MAG: cadherin-like domain-containing protein [Phycisphaeraceae bacterium]|nr:cadherin-like domain-containing protein [Phycisphaeraceae bacterium]